MARLRIEDDKIVLMRWTQILEMAGNEKYVNIFCFKFRIFSAFTFLVSAGLVDLKQRRDRLFLTGHFEKFLNYDYHMYL